MQEVGYSISGGHGRRRGRCCSGEEKKHLCKFNNSWPEELNVLSQSHVNNAHTFCKVCRTDFFISDTVGKMPYLSILNHSGTFVHPRYKRAALNTQC